MTNSGDAAETVVRVMLTGTEITLRLTASAAKNLLALSVALAKQHKQISGKTQMKKILKDTRDIRVFPMTKAQYRAFQKKAKPFRLLYASIRDRDGGGQIDLVLPATELDRANLVFEKMLYQQGDKASGKASAEKVREKEEPSKNVSRWPPDLTATRAGLVRSEAMPQSRTTSSERESVILRLETYRQQLSGQLSGQVTKVKKRGEREK